MRNEALRLPNFIEHYRRLGVTHFLIVDNASEDGGVEALRSAPDVSIWRTEDSYRDARFGMDWLGGLLMTTGSGHWCLTVDADELLVFDGWTRGGLGPLTQGLDAIGQHAFGAVMVELYPRGPLSTATLAPGDDPLSRLQWFDAGPFRQARQNPMGNLWVQGGARHRVFFGDDPARAPTMNKFPLVRWHWRYAYVNSTHALLPPRLNACWDGPGDPRPSGALLHTKFLADVLPRALEDQSRRQHFGQPDRFAEYYDAILEDPVLWHTGSLRFENVDQLITLGLIGLSPTG